MPLSVDPFRNVARGIAPEPDLVSPRFKGVLVSLCGHGVLFAFVLFKGIIFRAQPVKLVRFQAVGQIETSGGSHPVHIPLPNMLTAANDSKPVPRLETISKISAPTERHHSAARSGGGTPPSPHLGDGAGTAEIGNGASSEERVPAFPIFSPRPPVTDRALLPASDERIIVNVELDASGLVVGERLVSGIGNELDRIVLDTVKSWKFHPATIDGQPVSSEAELIFPFNLNYPIGSS